jgi:glycosyltransferase involved in cell wall biosynthesis/folate-dependent phosphoribosylglycinamide formyltransferase PurN
VFGSGPILTHEVARFLERLETHPDIALLAVFCQGEAASAGEMFKDLRSRRGILALPLFLAWLCRDIAHRLSPSRAERTLRRNLERVRDRIHFVEDIHSTEVLARLDELDTDIGLIYGAPILRPELFEQPRLGTLGIHHGKLPEYRGNKTAFWAMLNGERTAGVTIQKVNAGLDTGEIVEEGSIGIEGRSRRAVWRDLENLGLELYVRAILTLASGGARLRPSAGHKGRVYRNPSLGDLARFQWIRFRRRFRRARRAEGPTGVVLFTETFYPVIGGGETQARLLAEGLIARGVTVRVLTRRNDPNLPRVECVGNVMVHRVAPAGASHLRKWGLVLTSLRPLLSLRRHYGALFVGGFRIVGIPAVLVGRALRKTVVLKADSQGEMSGGFFEAGLARLGMSPETVLFRSFLRFRNWLLRRADAFVAISDDIAGELQEARVPEQRIHRIPNSVDIGHFHPVDSSTKRVLRRKLGLPDSGRIAIYTGRLVSYKGLPELLETWRPIASGHANARLLLVGTGGLDLHNCEEELRRYVREHALDESVVFTGAVDDVSELLQASDFFVFPTRNESFGGALVEAMACGLPGIATPVGAIPSIVEHEHDGIIVPPGDAEPLARALERCITDAEWVEHLGRAARHTVEERFSAERVTDEIATLLEELRAS